MREIRPFETELHKVQSPIWKFRIQPCKERDLELFQFFFDKALVFLSFLFHSFLIDFLGNQTWFVSRNPPPCLTSMWFKERSKGDG